VANKFSLAAIETAKQNLDAMPAAARETREVTLKEAIKTLSPTIRKLLRRGYSRARVVDLLLEQGVPVSLSTLKQYFREKVSPSDDAHIQAEPSTKVTTPASSDARREMVNGLERTKPSVVSAASAGRRVDDESIRTVSGRNAEAMGEPRGSTAAARIGPARS
jgi:hypothetical protein